MHINNHANYRPGYTSFNNFNESEFSPLNHDSDISVESPINDIYGNQMNFHIKGMRP